ncbi:GNAT family N-acetyltransferase [Burkholderia cepacia]|uniref:GNAT family N-acetyltransferase n=1 Tax=Burkholderia cepacia TaxID=292 RepID=UPI0038BE1BA1
MRDSVSADCGWFLLPDFWGKGYAAHAIRALLILAFELGQDDEHDGVMRYRESSLSSRRRKMRVSPDSHDR